MGRKGEIFIENREENIRVKKISLSQLLIVKIYNSLEFLTHLEKATPKGFISAPKMILVQYKLQ